MRALRSRRYQAALRRIRRQLGRAAALTVEVEGQTAAEPWVARAGMRIVRTEWDHDARHLHLELQTKPTVFVVESGDYADREVLGVYSSEAAARVAALGHADGSWSIEAVKMDTAWDGDVVRWSE